MIENLEEHLTKLDVSKLSSLDKKERYKHTELFCEYMVHIFTVHRKAYPDDEGLLEHFSILTLMLFHPEEFLN
jgi:hypothetical protein